MKFFLFVLGCQMNISDAERLRFLLTNLGLKETASEKEADLILVVACSVRQKPIDRIWGKLKAWRLADSNQYLVLTGCVTKSDKKKFIEKFDFVFNVQKPQELVKFLRQKKLIDLKSSRFRSTPLEQYSSITLSKLNTKLVEKSLFDLAPMRKDKNKAYIALGNGCNNFCTYCVVPYTRGREIYRPINEIINEVKIALKNGAKIISLIAQNVNSYKSKVKSQKSKVKIETQRLKLKEINFIDLLIKINSLPGNFKIEFLTSHPKDMSDELIKTVAKLSKVIKWIHLPVQAGSNEILEKMNRKYTREHYLKLVKKIRKAMPRVVLTTDIIVGFPGETKAQFEETVDLVQKAKFDQAFIAMYSPRPGTAAVNMNNNVSQAEKKRRFSILDKLINKKNGPQKNPWTIAQQNKK